MGQSARILWRFGMRRGSASLLLPPFFSTALIACWNAASFCFHSAA